MFVRRHVLVLLISVLAATAAQGQTYHLVEPPAGDSYFRVEMHMDLKGEMKVRQDNKDVVLKQAAQANHEFLERVLETGKVGLADRSARLYKTAEAKLGDEPAPRKLRAERALIIAHRYRDQIVAYALKGLLTREELELTEHFDTLALPGLLPTKDVAVGAAWTLSKAAAQALCDLDGLTDHDLSAKLAAVQGERARISISGSAAGIDLGASVKMTVTASVEYDLKAGCIVAVEWKQHDERDQGPISPAMKADVVTTLKRVRMERVGDLHDFALARMPDKGKPPAEELLPILDADPKGRFELTYPRAWHLVGRTDEHMVLRLLDRGDFVAQATLTPWKKVEPGKHLTLEQFQAAMAQAPFWEQDKVVDKSELSKEGKNIVYRVAATGQLDGEETVQYFYLVAGPQGEQTVLTFTMTPKQAQKLESRDLSLIRGLTYPAAASAEISAEPH